MFSLKKVSVSFVIGFTISLIAGIGGGVDFGALFFRAILSGLFFGAFVSGAIVLFQKFFLNGESPFDVTQQKDNLTHPGSNINIVLDDDELPDSETAPSFILGESESSSSENSNEVLESNLNDSFQAGKLDTIAASSVSPLKEERSDSLSQKPLESTGAVERSTISNEENRNMADTELDMLPDIENLVDSDDAIQSSNGDEVVQDSVFAEIGETKPIIPAGFSDMGDSRDIAAAIRTTLVKEE